MSAEAVSGLFFSSRRRHTRFDCDWSSDVCSSDLVADGRWAEDVPGLYRALNALLPRDIWVERVSPMRPGFHARNSALARRYRYVIGTDDAARSPFRRPYEWAFGRPLDVALLAGAAELLPRGHDFRGLAATGAGSGRPHYR